MVELGILYKSFKVYVNANFHLVKSYLLYLLTLVNNKRKRHFDAITVWPIADHLF